MDILKKKGIKTQKIKGTEYVYQDKPYWDKAKKQNRHKKDYIGKLGKDGEFIPNKKYLERQNIMEVINKETTLPVADRKFFGATHILDSVGEITGIARDLKESFGLETAKKISSLAYFLILESESSMYRFKKFAKTHKHPFGEVIASQRISEIFLKYLKTVKLLFSKTESSVALKTNF